MARPHKEIDKKQFEQLCGLQCTLSEICGWFGVTDKTLDSWCRRQYHANFSEVFKEKRGLGKISLRRSQWKLAEKNANMAIWLGKQYLGQSDIQKEEKLESGQTPVDELSAALMDFMKEGNNEPISDKSEAE